MGTAAGTLKSLIRHRNRADEAHRRLADAAPPPVVAPPRPWAAPPDPELAAAVAALKEDLLEAWHERAAILEADAGLPRAEADRLAFEAVAARAAPGRPLADGAWRREGGRWTWTARGFEDVDFGEPPVLRGDRAGGA